MPIKRYSKKSISRKTKRKIQKKTKRSKKTKQQSSSRRRRHQKGGFAAISDCQIATVREPGINIAGTANIGGLSIGDSRAAIFRPDCKVDTNQAMVP